MYEVWAAMRYSYYANKDLWEANRLIAYMVAQVNSKKRLQLQDIVRFPWEEVQGDTSISKEDIERLRIKAENYLKLHK